MSGPDENETNSEDKESKTREVEEEKGLVLQTSTLEKRDIDTEHTSDEAHIVKKQKTSTEPDAAAPTGFAAVAAANMGGSFASFGAGAGAGFAALTSKGGGGGCGTSGRTEGGSKNGFGHPDGKASTGFCGGFTGGGFSASVTNASHFQRSATQDSTVAVPNGEEEEAKVYEVRCKLYQLREGKWAECGIGPLRILQSKSNETFNRIVIRRESYPHGPGTKLLLNRRLSACTAVDKVDDKSLRLSSAALVDDKPTPETHLLRVNEDHLMLLQSNIETRLCKK